jgi:hypothetical protein
MAHVTVPNEDPSTQHAVGASSSGPFVFNFTIFDLTDIKVIVTPDATGVDDELTYSTEFSVSGNGGATGGYDGGTVTLVTAVANTQVTIYRDVPIERTDDHPTTGSFNITSLNTTLDKLFAIAQQIYQRTRRSALVSSSTSDRDFELPAPEAGTVLRWNDDEDALENAEIVGDGSITVPVPIAQGGTGAITAALGFTALAAAGGTIGGALTVSADVGVTGDLTLTSTDAGAAVAPSLKLYRNSASPAASDVLGQVLWQGEDSAGNTEDYASAVASILDPTSTSEDGKLTFKAKVAGTLTDIFHYAAGLWLNGATGGDPGAGKVNATDVQIEGTSLQRAWTYGTQMATTSGTTVELSATIPDWVTEIEILFKQVSTSSQAPLVQLGDSGGYETTVYVWSVGTVGTAGATAWSSATDGFLTFAGSHWAATDDIYGVMRLSRWDTAEHTWMATLVCQDAGASSGHGAGTKTLSAALDRIRLTTQAGASTFDAGECRLRYR